MQPSNRPSQPSFPHAKSTLNGAGSAGASRHHKKMTTQASQVQGGGATTGGFATSPGAPVVPNKSGKFLSKGKN